MEKAALFALPSPEIFFGPVFYVWCGYKEEYNA